MTRPPAYVRLASRDSEESFALVRISEQLDYVARLLERMDERAELAVEREERLADLRSRS